jgi:hypothetical protein
MLLHLEEEYYMEHLVNTVSSASLEATSDNMYPVISTAFLWISASCVKTQRFLGEFFRVKKCPMRHEIWYLQ